MITNLVITDLTRMYQGKVCIAGYDKNHCCIRPILPPPGIAESTLVQQGQPVIFPFALVEFDLLGPDPQPPHTEDYFYRIGSPRLIRRVQDRREVLHWSQFENVAAIFDQPIRNDTGYYVMDCQGPRSVGTIRPRGIARVTYAAGPEGSWDYRLNFYDGRGDFYRLKITDLTWHYYCNSLRGPDCDPARIAADLTTMLKSSTVYLRIGLSRGWKKFPGRCFLQINGIYTFPDYLQGKIYSDFTRRSN